MTPCSLLFPCIFLALLVVEVVAEPCPSSQYQTKPLVLDCSPGSGTFRLDVTNTTWKELGEVPAGYADVQVDMVSSSSMHLVVLDGSGNCIAGYACAISTSCDNTSHFCHQHGPMRFSLVSSPYFGTGVQESIAVMGLLPLDLTLAASLATRPKAAVSGTVGFSHAGTAECPKPLPGCQRCQDFMGCEVGETPVCNGTSTPSCSTDPAIPADENWFELRLGGSPLPSPGAAGCLCCELPVGDTVRIGMALPLFSTGDFPAEREGHQILSALRSLFQWFNSVRGGLCRTTLRHRVELFVLDAGAPALRAATQRLAYDYGVEFFLGPPSFLAPVAEMAERLQALVLAPSTAASSTFRGCRFCFGLHPPAARILEPAFTLLSQAADSRALRIASATGSDEVSAEICGAVPLLAAQHGMTFLNWTVDLTTAAAPTADAVPATDAMIFCPEDFEQCLAFVEYWKALPARSSPSVVILAGKCVQEGLLSLPGYGGFLWAVTPKNPWAMASSEAADAGWSGGSTLSTSDVASLLSLAPSAVPAATAYPTGNWLNQERFAELQQMAERLATESGRRGGVLASWAAASVLLSAMEVAENITVQAVSDALERSEGLQTILGLVKFDASRQSSVGATVLQQVSGTSAGEPQIVAESTLQGFVCTWRGCSANARTAPGNGTAASNISRPVFPVPKPELERQCYHRHGGSFGFRTASFGFFCAECPVDEVSDYDEVEQRRFCRRCSDNESVQELSNGSRLCVPCGSLTSCTPGQYRSNCGCQDCPEGSFSNSSDASVCEDCPEGYFSAAGVSACEPCPAGTSSYSGSGQCVNCTLGTFAELPGSPCRPCPGGSHAPAEGLTACLICEAGSRSSWDGSSCDLCPPMTYQHLRNSSMCLPAQEGAEMSGTGMAIALNRAGFWIRKVGSHVSWEACLVPDACLANATCAEGSTGVQCLSCLPGYVRSRLPLQDSCEHCAQHLMILNLVLFLSLVVVMSLWLAKLGVEKRNNPKDLRLGYLKFLLLYLIIEGALAQTCIEILNDFRSSLGDLGLLLKQLLATFTWSPHLVAVRCLMDHLAHARYLRGEGVAVSSIVAGWSSAAADSLLTPDVLAESLARLNHTSWFSEESGPLRESLKDFQYSTELYALAFWVCLPLVLWLLLYISNFLYVWICLIWDSSFNSRAITFYQELVEDGTKETLATYDAEDWLAFIQAYFQKWGFFGLWSWDLAEARAEGFCAWARVFTKQSRPLLISLILVLYGSVLDGLLQFVRCGEVPDEDIRRSLYAQEVECQDWDTHLARLSAAMAACWLFGVPMVLGYLLHRARNNLSDDFEFPPEVSVLSFGYRLGCWGWESYLFLLKGFVISGNHLLSPTNRSSFLFLLAVIHGFLSRAFHPFTSRSDFAMVKADGHFALFFVVQSILIQFLAVSTSIPRNLRILGVLLVSLMVLLNVLLVGYLVASCFGCWQDTLIESYEFYDWELWKSNRRCFSRFLKMPMKILQDHYKRRVRRRPYVSFDPTFGWLTVCGSRGDLAKATVNWHGGQVPDLSGAPAVPNAEVEEATAGQRRKVQKYLQQAAERLCLIKGSATFSILEMEFIIRAAFVFARRAELQKSKLARPLTLISKEESFMGLDALELLWSSLELEEPGEEGEKEEEEEEVATTPSTPPERRTRASFARTTTINTRASSSSYEPLAPRLRRRYQTQLICHFFFNDSTRVLFFYSRVEFIRQAQVAKTQAPDVRNRMSTIATERTAAWELLTTCVRRLRDVISADVKALRDRDMSKAKMKKKSKTFETFNRRVAQTKMLSSFERVEPLMQEMFNDETFARGVELQDFQLGLIVVEHTGDSDLKELQDAFHERWFQHRQLVEHRLRTSQGLLKEEGTQADADEELGAAMQEAEAEHLIAEDERPTVEDLRWMRLVLKAGGGIFKEKVMPSLGEINDLLRSRREDSTSSSSS